MTLSSVPLRRCATWQIETDDRLLELLRGEGWTSPRSLAAKPTVHLSVREVRRRLRMLADGGLVAPSDPDFDLYHLTTNGELYLDGERNQELHPHPFIHALATQPLIQG